MKQDRVKYELVDGEVDATDLAELLCDLLDDPRCEGFDGLTNDKVN